MNIKKLTANYSFDGNVLLIAEVAKDESIQALLNSFEPNKYDLEITKRTKKRSLDANAYLWTLCDKLAKVLGSTDEEVYREMVVDYGVSEIVPLKTETVENSIRMWQGRGKGWIAEILAPAKTQGYTNVKRYYGSSVYDSKQMSVLIDGIITECKEQGIETLPSEEVERLKGEWK